MDVRPPTNLHAKWLRRRGFTQGCAFCSKNRYFSYPLISTTVNAQNLTNFWTSSEPNESDILNRQSADEKLEYVLKFCIGYTSRDIAHAQRRISIVSMSTWCLRQNISETVREGDFGKKGPPIENDSWRVEWSRDGWRKVNVVTPICLGPSISETAWWRWCIRLHTLLLGQAYLSISRVSCSVSEIHMCNRCNTMKHKTSLPGSSVVK